jgi:hypothetical protein
LPHAPEQGRFGSSQPTLQLGRSCPKEVSASSPSTDLPRSCQQPNWRAFGQQEGAHSLVRLQLHCRDTHLQKEVENQILQAQITRHNKRVRKTYTSGISQDS